MMVARWLAAALSLALVSFAVFYHYHPVVVHDTVKVPGPTIVKPGPTVTKQAPPKPAVTVTKTPPPPPPQPPPSPGPTVTVTVAPPKPPAPEERWVLQDPKYRASIDFLWDATLSIDPLGQTPWMGSGPPTLVIQYHQAGDSPPLNDTHLLLVGVVTLSGEVGYDFCKSPTIRFRNFTASEATRITVLTYRSDAIPNDYEELLGTGSSCYTRLLLKGHVNYAVCMEGDGRIDKEAVHADANGTLVLHVVDAYDYCIRTDYAFAPPALAPAGRNL